MISNEFEEHQICSKHNLPQEFLNPDKSNPNQQYACNQCIINYHKPISIQQIKQSNQKLIKQFEQQLEQNRNIWNISIDSLISIRETFIKQIKIIENIIDVIRNQIQQSINEFKNIKADKIEEIKQGHEQQVKNQQTHYKDIIQQIKMLRQDTRIDKLIDRLNEINLQKLTSEDSIKKISIAEIENKQNVDQIVVQNLMEQQKVKRYNYELISEYSISQNDRCLAIAFNNDGSIVVAGCVSMIKVFEFQNKKLKEVQSLNSHKSVVTCLQFMKNDNQFISGSFDNTIKIWQLNNTNQWINIQTLQEHKNWIYCLIINSNDDLIVTGSRDKSIIFWRLNQNRWYADQQIQCSSQIYSLSLNDSNTKLISPELNNLIQVFEQQGKKWMITQKIQPNSFGMRLCFISDDQFVFLPYQSKDLYFYKFDLQSNKFEEKEKIEINNGGDDYDGFPIKFIKQKNLLIVKNSKFVNILRKQENQLFIQDQSIEFKHTGLYGDVSKDGNFMITWDYSKSFKFNFLYQMNGNNIIILRIKNGPLRFIINFIIILLTNGSFHLQNLDINEISITKLCC